MKKPFLRQLISGSTPPSRPEFHTFLDRVMNNETGKGEVVAFLAGLSARPLCPENVNHFVSYHVQTAPVKPLAGAENAVNIVGTGGGISTFNISTAVAFVASAAGAKVLKSGSAAYSSQCGSLDVLNALGVPMPATESQLADMIGEFGIGFVPASHYGPLLKQLFTKVLPLAFRDIAGFVNTIGPLLCPYKVSAQLIGVGRLEHLEVFSEVLSAQKPPKTLLVHASCGMDEFSSVGVNYCRLIAEDVHRFSLAARSLGFGGGSPANLAGGTVQDNVAIFRAVLNGARRGEARDTVVLNAAALLYLAGAAASIEEGVQLAEWTIDGGAALHQLERVVAWGSTLSPKSSRAAAII
jgi:anthranilate phosphoribosyltransferase